MRYLKTYESFSINEEEEIFKQAAGFFGAFNSDTKARAEKALEEWSDKHPGNIHSTIFSQLKEAYDSKSGTTLEKSDRNPFKYERTELSAEEVKSLYESICCLVRMNDANAFGIEVNKDGKLEAYQSKSYSASHHSFGSGTVGRG